MKTSTKIILAVTLAGSLGVAGFAQNVYAVQNSTQLAQASNSDSETNDDREDRQEEAKLRSLAKITPQQALQAAETAEGGKASSVELENEDGSLVYEVVVGQKEVVVDAGDGKVLYAENVNQEDDKNEASRPKSSIQVPNSDSEANDDGRQQQGR